LSRQEIVDRIRGSLDRVERWVERHGYKGYEPSDGLTSFLRPLTFDRIILERLLQQVGRQSPLNLRPLMGVKPLESTKGRGYMALGYLDRYRLSGDEAYKDKAVQCLQWLDQNRSAGYAGHGWGNAFPMVGRGNSIKAHEPMLVWTSLIGLAFIEAYQTLRIERHLEVIDSITEWVLGLPTEKTETGVCLSYVPSEQSSIHNSNMLGAGFLAKAAALTRNEKARAVARSCMEYSCSRQLPDGSWYYGEEPMYHWIDNFHTGYNLDSLKRYIEATGDHEYEEQLRKGLAYYKERFFDEDGRPRYYHDRAYPIDIQCSSQAVETLSYLSDRDDQTLEMACRVALWTIQHMQAADGHFHYRIYPLKIQSKIPMLHWGQATNYRALAFLLVKLVKD
jgi:rhamnogalacturonyl hydrolase YesR